MAHPQFSTTFSPRNGIRAIVLCLACCFGYSPFLNAQTIYALSGNNLISFSATAPSTLLSTRPLSGIAAGQAVVGLDFRPQTGELYALGYNQGSGMARLYTINLNSGAATAIGNAPMSLNANMGKVAMDFNPTVDRIRVTGSDNSNYRMHPTTGALVATDGNLMYAATDVNAATDPNVVSVAYTNSYIGSTSTTLYNYDDMLNVFTTQIPPNDGVLNTIGSSGVMTNAANTVSDFDIYFDAMSGANRAFFAAAMGTQTTSMLYTVNLGTGAATPIGLIGNGMMVSKIAVLIDRTIPPNITGPLVYALASNNNLISFDAAMPGVVRRLVPISGIAMGQTIAGLDFRPATGELYALGYNNNTGDARLYTVDPNSGMANPIGSAPFSLNANMGKVSMDFNPTVDRIRVTGSDRSNYRLHPVTGVVVATDGNLVFASNDINAGMTPSIGTGAYTNSFATATTTTLYNYDDVLHVLTTQIPPNDGVLNTIGMSGIMVNTADPSSDLDIFYSQYGTPNRAFLAANVGDSSFDNLYTVNLGTGVASFIGRIGNGIAITDIAIAPQASETACDTKTADCVRYELLSISKNTSGDKTYRIRVTNNCADRLEYVVFQLPNGITAVEPSQSSAYASAAGLVYDVRNPNFSPFYSIRFKVQGSNGIANGQSDLFEYSLPSTANPNFILAGARVGFNFRSTHLNVFSCALSSSSLEETEERNAERSGIGGFNVFPNPSNGLAYVDLSAWADQPVQLRAFNVQGQLVLHQNVTGGSSQEAIEWPRNTADGLYLIEMQPENGEKQHRKLILQR